MRPSFKLTTLSAFIAVFLVAYADREISGQPGVTVRIAMIGGPSIYDAHIFVAREAGFYKGEGVQLETKTVTSIAQLKEALEKGDVDVARVSSLVGLSWISSGLPWKIISASVPISDRILVGKDGGSLKDIEGQQIAVHGTQSTDIALLRFVANLGGINVKTTQYLTTPTWPAMVAAAKEKSVPFAIMALWEFEAAGADPGFKSYRPVLRFGDQLPDFDFIYELASDKALKEKSKALEGFVAGTILGAREMGKNEKWAAEVVRNSIPALAKAEFGKVLALVQAMTTGGPFGVKGGMFSVNGGLNKATVEFTAKLYRANGDLVGDVSYESAAEARYVAAALQRHGKVTWGKGPRPCERN